jgi:hypothetical protein
MSWQEPKELRDPRAIRALAHPHRLTLLELVGQEGSLTSARAAELTGESTASCSFHLRQLAKYGFIEPAEGGKGRERPWRLASVDVRWSDEGAAPELAAAADELTTLLLERDLALLERYLRTRTSVSPEWRQAATATHGTVYVTAEELAELGRELIALRERFAERLVDPKLRPPDARAVRLVGLAIPSPEEPS